MYPGTSDRFSLDRRIREETRERLSNPSLVDCRDLREPLFVTDWFDDGTNIVGVGCTRNDGGMTAKLTLSVKPGLFLVTSDVRILRRVASVMGYENVLEFDGITYEANNFSLYDIMCDPEQAKDVQLVKIETPTSLDSVILYHRIKRDPKAYRYASVTHYWDATKQVMFELIVRRHRQSNDFTVPKITYRWFNSELQVLRLPQPKLPIITFDIETVSTDPHRVPTGEDINDVLFTSSIHHLDSHIIYTLVYLPIEKKPSLLKEEMLRADKYPKYDGETNVVEVFTSELDLLVRTIGLLCLNGRHHYLIGYNSLSYDIKYLLVRCYFYGRLTGRFVWKEGYTLGFEQIHIDLFRVSVMRYTYKKYTLSFVAKQLLKDDKVNVDAVALRFTFHRMKKRQKIYEHGDQEGLKRNIPSLRDTLHYNNYDTLLVSKLVERTRTVEYLLSYAHECRVPLCSMNSNYNKMQYKVLNECLVLGLGKRKFLTTFKGPSANMIIPLPDLSQSEITLAHLNQTTNETALKPHDYVMVCQDLDALITPGSCGSSQALLGQADENKKKYPGGANFCLGEHNVTKVQAYDYRIAYPLLIDRKNLSDETAELMPADKIMFFYDYIHNKHQYSVYDYMAHAGSTKTETKIMFYQYLYCGTYCGGQFPFSKLELQRRGTSPVIIIWHNRRGVLADIITVFNDKRENTKNIRKKLDGVLSKVDAVLKEYSELDERPILCGGDGSAMETGGDVVKMVDGCLSELEATDIHSIVHDDFGFESSDFGCDHVFERTANEGDFGMDVDNIAANNEMGGFGCDDVVEVQNISSEKISDICCTGFAKNLTAESQEKTTEPITESIGGFRFENEIIKVFENGQCFIDEEMLQKCQRPVQVLNQLVIDISMERDEFESSYRLQKSRVASIYGIIGSLKPRLAALITCMIRTVLLQSGRNLIENHGCTLYYCDTDSLFVVNPGGQDMSATLNQLHPHTEIEMKTIERCMFVQTKIYYYWSDGKLHYGHNANGPQAWHDMISYFVDLTELTTLDDIYEAFKNFYFSVRKRLIRESLSSGLNSFLRLTQDIKIRSTYKTMTPANEFKIYLTNKYPALAGSFRHNVYYYQQSQDVVKTVYRPSIELVESDANPSPDKVRSMVTERLGRVNLFKYFYNMFKTVFNIVKFRIKQNNKPFNVTLNDANVRVIMLRAYLDYLTVTQDRSRDDDKVVERMAQTLSAAVDEGTVYDK